MTTVEIRLSGACDLIVTRNIEYFYILSDYFKNLKLNESSDTFLARHIICLATCVLGNTRS